ncbi:MAG TPA: HDOD domain-containing protein [Rhodocyclaceae bacterium]|jgi:HD-like signal output (HDOD) protein|nr:HDOD domain-containing protein [Rhodocyclaceae bacterium]
MEVAATHQLSKQELDQVLSTFEIPTCPAMVAEVMAEARKDEPDIRKIAAAITADVGMSAITLKMANSALFRSGSSINNVHRALDRLGMRNVLSVVLGVALRSSMQGLPSAEIERVWARTSILAQSCGILARNLYGIPPDEAYTYALFHDAAIPLMLKRFPNYPKLIAEAAARGESRIQAERQLPCTHPIIGSLLVRNWGLPLDVSLAIRFHHEPDVYTLSDETLPGTALSLIAVGQVVEQVMTEVMPDQEDEVGEAMFIEAMRHLGMPLEERDSIADIVRKSIADASA